MIRKTLCAVIPIVALLLLLVSCDILRDSPFEVSGWSPGGGYHAAPEALTISVSFSHDPERSSAENGFSLTGSGESVRGIFQWEGRKMSFLPFAPLEANRDYSIRISSTAQDTKGLSMDRDFEGSFSTRPDYTRPHVVSMQPAMEGVMDSARGSCVIEFSFPISLNSLRNNVFFSPSMSGAWHLESEGMLAVFTPSEPWPQGRRFELRLSSSLTGENGMVIARDFFSIFTVGVNRELPDLAGAWRITEAGDLVELVRELPGEFTDNAGWEKGDRLKLAFRAKVDLLSVAAALTVEGASPLVPEMPFDAAETCFKDEVFFHFERPPAFESRFSLRLRRGVKDLDGNESVEEHSFRVFANGENSKPPSLVGIRMPMSPDGPLEDALDMRAYDFDSQFADLPIESEHYPYSVKTETWIECYFDCAPGVSVDPFSFMEMFRIETSNNVIVFSPRVIRNDNFIFADPHPSWETYQRLEIAGTLTNTTNAGLVHFLVNQGLQDTAGNSSEKQFRISLVK